MIDDAVLKNRRQLCRVGEARDAARASEGLVAAGTLIRVAVYDLELSNLGMDWVMTTEALRKCESLKVYPQLAWMRSARC